MTGWAALFIFMLAAFVGYEVIGRVPVILHTPLMSGSNFVHGVVMVGAMVALGEAHTTAGRVIGFLGVLLGTANAVGGYAVTDRMLEMFMSSRDQRSRKSGGSPEGDASTGSRNEGADARGPLGGDGGDARGRREPAGGRGSRKTP